MGLLNRLAPRRPEGETPAPLPPTIDPVFATKALRKFLVSITAQESPVLLDLGPVVGSNVSFFGEQLGCKIFVEDIFADLDRHVRGEKLEALPAFLKTRFPQAEGSVDEVDAADPLVPADVDLAVERRLTTPPQDGTEPPLEPAFRPLA